MSAIIVRLYTPLRRHGRLHCHCTLSYDGSPAARRDQRVVSLSRNFACECGEPMQDGDPFDTALYDRERRIVHANCAGGTS